MENMTQQELAAHVNALRLLRTSPPTMTKALRDDPDVEVDPNEPKKSKPKARMNAATFLSGLADALKTTNETTTD